MFTESVQVEVPGKKTLTTSVRVDLDDDDQAVALRVAGLFPPGTILRLQGGSEWVVAPQEPPVVTPHRLSQAELPPFEPRASERLSEAPAAGTPFRPKRRASSGFRVKAVRGQLIETDDGRIIEMDELGRTYRQIG